MKIYKRNQGRYARLASALVVLLLSAWGMFSLYTVLSTSESIPMWVTIVVPLALLGLIFFFVYKASNSSKAAEFLIATEGEMKKVSWSTKAEVIGSTKVVIVATFMMAAFLFLVDIVFSTGFKVLGVTY